MPFVNIQVQISKSELDDYADAQKIANEIAANVSKHESVYSVSLDQEFDIEFRDGDIQ